jgi:hypothetical protein
LVRSPTITKFESGRTTIGSRPLQRVSGSMRGTRRGGTPASASPIARMWSGVVPQQPPATLSQPASANSRSSEAVCAGVSSYSPKAFGSPAFG